MIIYLDNSATTKVSDDAAREMMNIMTNEYGNPSSLHSYGLSAEKELKKARLRIASALDADPSEIVFTSCGTESDNLAILGTYGSRMRKGNEIITSKVEHPAVLEACRHLEMLGAKVHYLNVNEKCMIDIEELKACINEKTVLISIMSVNNETGSIMPVREINAVKRDAVFHTDAVQAFGKNDIRANHADMISLSAHKIHGPKGIGALCFSKKTKPLPLLFGGGQEKGLRSGTENLPGIVGFGIAAEYYYRNKESIRSNIAAAKERLLCNIKNSISDIRINSPENGSSAILNVSFMGARSEVILHRLEQSGIMVSSGSACSSGKKGASHVLKAMGLSDKETEGAIRFSFGMYNTVEEMDYTAEKLKEAVEGFRKLGSYR